MQVEDYPKEVLVQYIKQRCFYNTEDLDQIKKDLEFKNLMAKSEKLRKEMKKYKGIENISQYVALMEKDNVIQKKIDKLLGL